MTKQSARAGFWVSCRDLDRRDWVAYLLVLATCRLPVSSLEGERSRKNDATILQTRLKKLSVQGCWKNCFYYIYIHPLNYKAGNSGQAFWHVTSWKSFGQMDLTYKKRMPRANRPSVNSKKVVHGGGSGKELATSYMECPLFCVLCYINISFCSK